MRLEHPELQAALDERNESSPPDMDAPAILGKMRHDCTKARLSGPEGRKVSTALDLKEIYWLSDDGVFALVFREGKCTHCGQVARSKKGRVYEAAKRPPLQGRVGRV